MVQEIAQNKFLLFTRHVQAGLTAFVMIKLEEPILKLLKYKASFGRFGKENSAIF